MLRALVLLKEQYRPEPSAEDEEYNELVSNMTELDIARLGKGIRGLMFKKNFPGILPEKKTGEDD